MPVLTIHYDSSLDAQVSERQEVLSRGFVSILRERLFADPNRCQIVMLRALRAEPFPVYVRLDFRARDARTPEAVGRALQALAELITAELKAGVRLRAFAVESSILFALDFGGPDGPA